LWQGELDEDSDERLKFLFLVRKAYSKMLQRKVRVFLDGFHGSVISSLLLVRFVQIQHEQKQCDALESSFQTIRQATGLTDVNEIVKKFLTRHTTFEALQRQASMTRDRIEALKTERAKLSAALQEVSVAKGPSNDQRDTYLKLDDFERKLKDAEERCTDARQAFVRTCVALDETRTCVTKLLAKFPEEEDASILSSEVYVVGSPRGASTMQLQPPPPLAPSALSLLCFAPC
jgi:DNA repair ATPase RecN